TAYTGATQTITVAPALTDAPADNDDIMIIPTAPALGGSLADLWTRHLQLLDATGHIQASTLAADAITAAKIASDVTDEIWAKAMTEPAAVPAVNGTAIAAISWLL